MHSTLIYYLFVFDCGRKPYTSGMVEDKYNIYIIFHFSSYCLYFKRGTGVVTDDMTGEEVFSLDLIRLLCAILPYHHSIKVMGEKLCVGCQVQFEMPAKLIARFIKWLSSNLGDDRALYQLQTVMDSFEGRHNNTYTLNRVMNHLCNAVKLRSLSACVWDWTSLLRTECCWRLDSRRTSKSDSIELSWSEEWKPTTENSVITML